MCLNTWSLANRANLNRVSTKDTPLTLADSYLTLENICLSICLFVLFCSTLIYAEPHVCQAGPEFSLWLMINFSCQLDWIWEDDLSMDLWDYFLEELAKGERSPPEWATPSGSIPMCRKGNLSGEAVLVVLTSLLACGWVHLLHCFDCSCCLHWRWDPSSLAFHCGLKTNTSARIHKFLSTRLELLEHLASQTEKLLSSQSFQCEDISCWAIQSVSCKPI